MQSADSLRVRLDPVGVAESYLADGKALGVMADLGRSLTFPYDAIAKGHEHCQAVFSVLQRDIASSLQLAELNAIELTGRMAAQPEIEAPNLFSCRPKLGAIMKFFRRK